MDRNRHSASLQEAEMGTRTVTARVQTATDYSAFVPRPPLAVIW
jgi:hypothetical protein